MLRAQIDCYRSNSVALCDVFHMNVNGKNTKIHLNSVTYIYKHTEYHAEMLFKRTMCVRAPYVYLLAILCIWIARQNSR